VDLELFIALGGDADGDGMVWLSDWGKLRQNFGNEGSGFGWTDGNFDPWVDDKVWLSDWGLLRQRFANRDYTVGQSGIAAVPEPSTVVMLTIVLGGLLTFAWRRWRLAVRCMLREGETMQDSIRVNSAIDAVRCLYLARVAEQKGHLDAARRWQEMATRWLNRLEPNTGRLQPSPGDAS
jgi:hypothetical protein